MPRKYFIASDLHLEFRQGQEKQYWEAFPASQGCKLAIVAGDVTSFGLPEGVVVRHFEGLLKRFHAVLYVPGNHEYYGTSPEEVGRRLVSLERYLPSLKVLRVGETYSFDGQRFIGDTMWFPDRPEVHMYRRSINDSFQIKGLFPWCFTQSHLFMSFLRDNLREDDIVISHHVPNDVDTRLIWKNSPTQAYFVNRDCDLYLQNPTTVKPKAWIYGHTHDKHDYYIGRTHFICNPVGYPGENSTLPDAAEPAVHEI